MIKKCILYFTTNHIWGGSEVLWTQSAKKLREEGFQLKVISHYDFQLVKPYIQDESSFFNIQSRYHNPPLITRVLHKLGMGNSKAADRMQEFTRYPKPGLAVISQGNNVDGLRFMEFCLNNEIPFVTITHLVSESLWPALNDEKIDTLRLLFDQSRVNYFVSNHTLRMHEKILGYKAGNSRIIYNPFTKDVDETMKYPPVVNGLYRIALLGRLENFHKGYDLLIDVVSQDKWQQRNIVFTIYGNGPHLQLIKRLIEQSGAKNIIINGHIEKISEVWKENHLLMMPSRLEGQSLTLIEAMRFKRAAVVTLVGGIEELIEENQTGFIAEYPSVRAIDAALERAWEKRSVWEHMGITAHRFITDRHPVDAVSYLNEQLISILNA